MGHDWSAPAGFHAQPRAPFGAAPYPDSPTKPGGPFHHVFGSPMRGADAVGAARADGGMLAPAAGLTAGPSARDLQLLDDHYIDFTSAEVSNMLFELYN